MVSTGIVQFPTNQGLGKAFMAGLLVSAGADIIVNTDADNQYCADDIPNWLSRSFCTKLKL